MYIIEDQIVIFSYRPKMDCRVPRYQYHEIIESRVNHRWCHRHWFIGKCKFDSVWGQVDFCLGVQTLKQSLETVRNLIFQEQFHGIFVGSVGLIKADKIFINNVLRIDGYGFVLGSHRLLFGPLANKGRQCCCGGPSKRCMGYTVSSVWGQEWHRDLSELDGTINVSYKSINVLIMGAEV
jgi:hypothetical protein